jgi:hypothetical protein
MNAVEIEEAVSELASQPFDPQEFPFAFLTAFGNKETTVKRLRSTSSNSSDVPRGVLQQKHIHIATCVPGMVGATLKSLRRSPKTASLKARFVLATDGVTLEAEDLTTGETVACDYADFPNHFGFLLALAASPPSSSFGKTPSTSGRPVGSIGFIWSSGKTIPTGTSQSAAMT